MSKSWRWWHSFASFLCFFVVWSRDITNIYLITGTHHSGWKINMNVIIHKNTANIRTEPLTDSGIFRVQLVGNDQMYVIEWQKIQSSGFTSVDHIHWLAPLYLFLWNSIFHFHLLYTSVHYWPLYIHKLAVCALALAQAENELMSAEHDKWLTRYSRF